MKAPEAAETVKDLLVQVRKVTKGGNYIFRGENKDYGKVSSKLYRYSRNIIGEATLPKRKTKIAFTVTMQTLKKELKEFAQEIDFPAIEKILKENVLDQFAQKNNHPLNVEGIQKKLMLKDVQEYVDFENENHTLAELQHYGGSTNLIDFSYDLAVALFFACDGEPEEDGRLILLKADDEGIIPARKNQNNRIVFQKSVFVKRKTGCIQNREIKPFIVLKHLKSPLLTYVQNYFGIRTETTYGDLIGYIQNQEKHSEAYKRFFAGLIYFTRKKSEKAIECYKEAIVLKPNFTEACYYCGIAYENIHEDKRAIKSYDEAIKLNPKHAEAYRRRGVLKRKLNDKGAEKDIQKAAQLAEQQGGKFSMDPLVIWDESEK